MPYWLFPVVALLISWLLVAGRLRYAHYGLDAPNHRSLHEKAMPHGGGLGIVAASLLIGTGLEIEGTLLILVALLALLSLIDDLRHIPFWLRLVFHLGAATLVCRMLALPLWLWPLAIVCIGWMTNLYNFMDGADGLAGSQGTIGYLAYGVGFAASGAAELAVWCVSIAASCLGFLRFNWPPARIFMGDVGSIPLGFLAGALGVIGASRGAWPVWFPVLVFAPFVLDASVTLLRRALAGRRVWEPHREHYYQRMVLMDYGHERMTIRWGAVMAVSAVLAVALLMTHPAVQWFGFLFWLLILVIMGRWIDGAWQAKGGVDHQ